MENLELKEDSYLVKRLYEDLHLYKQGLMEIMLHLNIRNEIIQKFKGSSSDLYKYIKIGEILEDITKNYIDYESVSKCNGDIIDFKKVYHPKAEQEILDTEMFLLELKEDTDVDESDIMKIRMRLEEYKSKNIFKEFDMIEGLLLSIGEKDLIIYDEANEFIDKLVQFNKLSEIDKQSHLNDFCYRNLEKNDFVCKLINLYSDYNAVEVIVNINEFEGIAMFSRWDTEKLKPILKWNSQCYFNIINTLNNLQQLNVDLLDIKLVEKEIKFIDELQMFLKKVC